MFLNELSGETDIGETDNSGSWSGSGSGSGSGSEDTEQKNANPLWWLCLPLSPLIFGGAVFLIIILKMYYSLLKKYIKNKREQLKKYLYNTENIVDKKLSKKYIKKLNTENSGECKDTTCSICIETVTRKGITLNCKHHYHIECLQTWIKQQITCINKPTCPICRSEIIEIPNKQHMQHMTYTIYYDSEDESDYD